MSFRTSTHTFVELEVPAAFYDFVTKAMLDAKYHHVFEVGSSPVPGKDSGPIDMHGIALTRGSPG